MDWIVKHPEATLDMLGYIPMFLNENNPRRAAEQFDSSYGHGGGWRPFKGFKMEANGDLKYSGDPPIKALFETQLRDEVIRVYQHAWVAIIQPDGRYEIARLD